MIVKGEKTETVDVKIGAQAQKEVLENVDNQMFFNEVKRRLLKTVNLEPHYFQDAHGKMWLKEVKCYTSLSFEVDADVRPVTKEDRGLLTVINVVEETLLETK